MWVLLAVVLMAVEARANTRAGEGADIPEFFDDSRNIMILLIGLGIIGASALVAFLVFKFRGRSAAFENSLFQNLEDN